jgi:hypothetical protein
MLTREPPAPDNPEPGPFRALRGPAAFASQRVEVGAGRPWVTANGGTELVALPLAESLT